jgi:hypothetical protein
MRRSANCSSSTAFLTFSSHPTPDVLDAHIDRQNVLCSMINLSKLNRSCITGGLAALRAIDVIDAGQPWLDASWLTRPIQPWLDPAVAGWVWDS